MPASILVIGLVPPSDFTRFLGDLRARYPEAAVTALVGNPELRDGGTRADEYLQWSDFAPRPLLAELRRRRFDLLVVAFNREYFFTATYWKAVALAAASRARQVLFCEQAQLPRAVPPLSHLGAMPLRLAWAWSSVLLRQLWRVVALGASQLALLLLGLSLMLVLLGIIVVDLGVMVARLFRPPRRSQAEPR